MEVKVCGTSRVESTDALTHMFGSSCSCLSGSKCCVAKLARNFERHDTGLGTTQQDVNGDISNPVPNETGSSFEEHFVVLGLILDTGTAIINLQLQLPYKTVSAFTSGLHTKANVFSAEEALGMAIFTSMYYNSIKH
jgi:hypothetical protein